MKAILVLDDMPENCFKCKFQDWANCRIVKSCHIGDTRPDWCPLKPMPERKGLLKELPMHDTDTHYEQGYNACIDEILGDKE